jgi:hypothetical protein
VLYLHYYSNMIIFYGEHHTHLRFANDTVFMADTLKYLNTMLEYLNSASQKAGLKINMDKTKSCQIFMSHPLQLALGTLLSKLSTTMFT